MQVVSGIPLVIHLVSFSFTFLVIYFYAEVYPDEFHEIHPHLGYVPVQNRTPKDDVVEINFESKELARRCSEKKQRVRALGADGAKKLSLRLQQLQAAGTLADMRPLPGRCHELAGDRTGHLSLDLQHSYRLVLRPTADPPPMKNGGGLDWTEVDAVTVEEIVDYH